MRTLTLFAALAATGCTPCSDGKCEYGPATMANQDLAEAITWRDYYGEAGTPPQVTWVSKGDCDTFYGPDTGVTDPDDGACAMGVHNGQSDGCWVSVLPGFWGGQDEEAKHETWYVYAHELMHSHLQRTYGDPDSKHQRPEWGNGGHVDMPLHAVYLMRVQGGVW